MTTSFLNESSKNANIKREIIRLCIRHQNYCISDFSNDLKISVPTTAKLVVELISEGFLKDCGKVGTQGGRKPNCYGLNPLAGYFVGVEVARHHMHIAISDFTGEIIHFIYDIEFVLEANEDSIKNICKRIKEEVLSIGISWDKVLGVGLSLSGRVNPEKGYSLTYFVSEDLPITDALTRELQVPVFVDNDSRAMAYGEYMTLGPEAADKDMVFINLGWGLGMGMILNGHLYYGKSGFSGEIGHFPLLDNNIICRCGKVGCLETGASGSALHNMMLEKLKAGRKSSLSDLYTEKGDIELKDILQAIIEEDVLAIECIGEIGETLGRGVAGVINIFNPGLVVIGGRLIVGKDYLRLPIVTTVNRLSLSRVNSDTKIVLSKLGNRAASVGECLLSRAKVLGLL